MVLEGKVKKSSLMLDWKIINGTIIDGDGHPPRRADIGIANDRITAISETIDAPATRTFDADGQYVCRDSLMPTHIPTHLS